MLTSIAKLIASNLRLFADALDPKPVVSSDYTIHVKNLVAEDCEDVLKRIQATSPGRF